MTRLFYYFEDKNYNKNVTITFLLSQSLRTDFASVNRIVHDFVRCISICNHIRVDHRQTLSNCIFILGIEPCETALNIQLLNMP